VIYIICGFLFLTNRRRKNHKLLQVRDHYSFSRHKYYFSFTALETHITHCSYQDPNTNFYEVIWSDLTRVRVVYTWSELEDSRMKEIYLQKIFRRSS